MKICVIGAGAIGGLIAARLALTGRHEVSVLARASTAEVLRTQGLRLRSGGAAVRASVRVSEDASDLGEQDVVFIAVKAPALASAAAATRPLLGTHTLVVPAMNGVPWWFPEAIAALGGRRLASLDPDGAVAAAIPFRHVLGCVVHLSSSMPEPGLVDHKFGNGLIIGEPLGGASERAGALVRELNGAGFEASASADIRRDIWYKLWGNLTMNPVSALTGATVDQILGDALVRRFCTDAMREAAAVGAAIGCAIDQAPEDRHALTAKLGAFKTSMLQDVEAGREIELDGIVGAVHEIALRVGVEAPNIDAVLGLTRLFGRVHRVYAGA